MIAFLLSDDTSFGKGQYTKSIGAGYASTKSNRSPTRCASHVVPYGRLMRLTTASADAAQLLRFRILSPKHILQHRECNLMIG